jgi:hypothetical protein
VADAASALEEAVARERNACFATSQAKSRLSRTHSTDVGQLRHVPHATAKNNNTATRAGDRNAGESERERESVCVWDNQRWCVKAMGKNCMHVVEVPIDPGPPPLSAPLSRGGRRTHGKLRDCTGFTEQRRELRIVT